MNFKKKSTIFGATLLCLFAASLLFAQQRPTRFSAMLIKSIGDALSTPLEIDLITSQTTNPFTVKNSSGSTIASIDYLGNFVGTIAAFTGAVSGTTGTFSSGVVAKTVASGTAPKHFYGGSGAPLVTTTGTDTAGVATVTWVNEVVIPCNVSITGVSYLIGSVGGTDKVVVVLFNSAGTVVANSALDSSVTVGTTATMQRVPFTAPYSAIGPSKYYIGVSTNGTTAKLRTQAFGDNDAGQITGGTFNTLVAITPPATFTASQGPIAMLY